MGAPHDAAAAPTVAFVRSDAASVAAALCDEEQARTVDPHLDIIAMIRTHLPLGASRLATPSTESAHPPSVGPLPGSRRLGRGFEAPPGTLLGAPRKCRL